jgi:hypothetical protein
MRRNTIIGGLWFDVLGLATDIYIGKLPRCKQCQQSSHRLPALCTMLLYGHRMQQGAAAGKLPASVTSTERVADTWRWLLSAASAMYTRCLFCAKGLAEQDSPARMSAVGFEIRTASTALSILSCSLEGAPVGLAVIFSPVRSSVVV